MGKILVINKKLPQIIVPRDKLCMFSDWWDKDIRFQSNIPKAFSEGYLIYQFPQLDFLSDFSKDGITLLAKMDHITYREVENRLKQTADRHTTMYFKFLEDNKLYFERYEEKSTNETILSSKGTMLIGNTGSPELKMNEILNDKSLISTMVNNNFHNSELSMNAINLFSMYLVATALWYIATTKSTKYIYEHKRPVNKIKNKHQRIIQVNPEKYITTPIYDMGKIKLVKTEKLIQRREGWTYSHAFQVHGHYRHYRNGKIVFINSYIKGPDKELQSQKIILEPKTSVRKETENDI